MHSAQWDHNQSLIGKRVASIGTGASAIQYIPKIAPRVRQLDVYQRTPAWVLPRDERHYLSIEKKLFERFPVWRKLHRARLYWSNESRLLPIMTPAISKIGAEALKASIKLQVRDAQTAQKLTPDYALGCKRILISNTYYPTFNQPHVALITNGIQSIHANSIVDSQGIERPTDCIVFGTGFIVDPRIYMRDFSCTGLPGHDLMQDWKDASEAYYGMAVHGFPNMWQLVGPNSGLGHNSILFMIEAQLRYIIECMHLLRQQGSDFMHVRPEVQKQFNDKVQEQANKTVWASGCTSWYQQADGRNFAIWPWSTWKFWLETRKVNPNAFIFGQATATTKKVKHSIRQESVM